MKKLFLSLAAALAVGTLSANNLVSIGKTSVAPVIDGKADACYSKSMEMAGFTLPRSMEYAPEKTTLRLTYDDKYL